MKRLILYILLILFSVISYSQTVVRPFRNLYDNTLIVAKSGGQYTTIQSAINYAATQTPTADGRWIIIVYPGVYEEAITMYEYVDITGAGTKADVVITYTTTVVTLADSVEISNLTVRAGDAAEIYCFRDNGVACFAKVMDVHMESLYDGGSGWYGFWATAAGDYTFERCSYYITTSSGDGGGFAADHVAATIRVIDGDFYLSGSTGPPTSSKSHLISIATSNCTFYTEGNRFDGDGQANVFYAEDGTFYSSNDAMIAVRASQANPNNATIYIMDGFRDYTFPDDDILYFQNIGQYTTSYGDTIPEYFMWDEGDDRFELSNDFYVGGSLVINGGLDAYQADGTTPLYYHEHNAPAFSTAPGTSGATLTAPTANTLGGYQLNAEGHQLYHTMHLEGDWVGATDIIVEIYWEVNEAEAADGTVDLRMIFYYKGDHEATNKTQTQEVEHIITGNTARYTQHLTTITFNWDESENVVEVEDIISFILNLETDTSECDNVIINHILTKYQSTKPSPQTTY